MRNKHSRVPDFNKFKTEHGNKYRVEYSSRVEADGTVSLFESARTDIQAEINSHAAETDIAFIVSRLQMGDTSVLSSKKAMYGDFTQFPKTFSQMFDMVHRAEDAFESLPVDIKQSYDNDISQWFADIGSPDWMSRMGLNVEPDVPAESEVI